MKNYYKILGIPKTAAAQEIKRAYRRLVSKYHPDKNPNNKTAEEKAKEINEAYETLSDAEKKRHYDAVYNPNFSSHSRASKTRSYADYSTEPDFKKQANENNSKEKPHEFDMKVLEILLSVILNIALLFLIVAISKGITPLAYSFKRFLLAGIAIYLAKRMFIGLMHFSESHWYYGLGIRLLRLIDKNWEQNPFIFGTITFLMNFVFIAISFGIISDSYLLLILLYTVIEIAVEFRVWQNRK